MKIFCIKDTFYGVNDSGTQIYKFIFYNNIWNPLSHKKVTGLSDYRKLRDFIRKELGITGLRTFNYGFDYPKDTKLIDSEDREFLNYLKEAKKLPLVCSI